MDAESQCLHLLFFDHRCIDEWMDDRIMIILHNQQLQNQCLRPYPTPSQTNIQIPLQSQRSTGKFVAQMRKSYSSVSPMRKGDNKSQGRDRSKFQVNNWMANHFLSDVKEKFKEIFKQRSQNGDEKKDRISPRKNSTQNGRKLLNLSVNYEPATITDKKKLFLQVQSSNKSKKRPIDIKKGRLFKGTHRDYKDIIKKQISGENWMASSHLTERAAEEDHMEEEQREDNYLRSQYAVLQKKSQSKEEDRIKTGKKTIEPANHHIQLSKYQSEMLSNSLKRHSPFPIEEPLHIAVKQSLLSQMRCKLINDDHFSFRKRNSLTRKQEKRKQYTRQFRSKASLQLNLEV